jgi:hypothetical protein
MNNRWNTDFLFSDEEDNPFVFDEKPRIIKFRPGPDWRTGLWAFFLALMVFILGGILIVGIATIGQLVHYTKG